MDQSDTIHKAGNEGLEQEPGHLINFPVHSPVAVKPKMSCGREGSKSMGKFQLSDSKMAPLFESLPSMLEHGCGIEQHVLCSYCNKRLECLPLACLGDDTGDLEMYMSSCKRKMR